MSPETLPPSALDLVADEREDRHLSSGVPSGAVIAAVAALALVGKLLLALKTYGTNDVYAYEQFLNWSRYLGVDIYHAAWDMNHPPSMLHALRVIGGLANATGLPFSFCLRLPSILADAGSLWLIWRILESRRQEASIRWALLMLAAAPALILVSGFHGNTDAVLVFFLLLAVYLLGSGRIPLAGASLGMALSVKISPVIVIPVMFLHLKTLRTRMTFLAAASCVLLLTWSPYIFQSPVAIIQKTLGYRSIYGQWGLSYLALHLAGPNSWLNMSFAKVGVYCLLASIAWLSLWMSRDARNPSLFSQVGIVVFTFLAFSNGFGVQYLVWAAPFAVGLGAGLALVYYLASGAFVFLVYNYWSEGLPWYLADSNRVGGYPGHLDYSQVLCWLSVLLLLWAALRQNLRRPAWESEVLRRLPSSVRMGAVALLMITLVILPAWRQANRDARPLGRLDGAEALRTICAGQYLALSAELYRANRHREAIAVAHDVLGLKPDSADAFNNIAASSAALGLWDQAMENARAALQIQPNHTLARNNLAWAVAEKEKAGSPGIRENVLTAADYLNLSLEHYAAGRYPECIMAARAALELRPEYAEAFNNLAAAYASLQKWDDAIRAAREAVRLKPDFQLARNNLAWAETEKQKRGRSK